MIARLLKYDLKKITKILIYMWVITLAFAGLTAIVNIWNKVAIINIISHVLAGFAYAGIVNVLVNTFVHILRNVISNFYKDESYLTHSLPIKKDKLLLSKYLSSLIVILCSVVVCFLSLFIMFYSPSLMEGLSMLISATVAGFNMPSWLFISLIVLIIFAQICATEAVVNKILERFCSFEEGRLSIPCILALLPAQNTGDSAVLQQLDGSLL